MNITPLEIRQKTFEKGFRGYEKDEVTAFLQSLSVEWQKLQDENKELKAKMENLEKEVQKLREVESSLYKTLKTAEDTGATIKDQATKMAELHMKETEMKAEALLNDAKNKSRDTIEQAEIVAKQTIEDMESELKNLLHSYKNLENFRDDLISDIKGLASDALDRVERLRTQSGRVDIEEQFMQARRESKKLIDDRLSENSKIKNREVQAPAPKDPGKTEAPVSSPPPSASESPKPQAEATKKDAGRDIPETGKNEETVPEKKDKGSFFDEID